MIFKFLITLSLVLYSSASFSEKIIEGKPIIIDGDTIYVDKNKIRLHGIDAPETNQKCTLDEETWNCGIQSTLALKNFILDKEVYCEIIDIDQYKRFVGICFVDNKNMNKYMVRNGWAIAYRYYSTLFVEDEEIAQKQKSGIWQGTFIEPYLFRKKNK